MPVRTGMRLGSAGIVSPIAGRNMLGGVKGRSAARLSSRMSAIGLRDKRPLSMRKGPNASLFTVNGIKGRMGSLGGKSAARFNSRRSAIGLRDKRPLSMRKAPNASLFTVNGIKGRMGSLGSKSDARFNSRRSAIGLRDKRPLSMRKAPNASLFAVNGVKGRMGIVGGRKSGLPILQKRLRAKIPTMKRRMPGFVSPIKGRDMLGAVKGRSGVMLKSRMASIGLRNKRPLSMRKSPKMNLFRVNSVKDRMGLVNGRSNRLLSNRLIAGKPVVVGNSALETNLLKRSGLDSRFDRPIIVRNNIGAPLVRGAMSKNLLASKAHLGVGMPSLRTGLKSGALNNMGSLQGILGAKSFKRQPVQKMPLQKRSFGINDKQMGIGAINKLALMQR